MTITLKTVAPHKDICPKNAVAIIKINITVPIVHTKVLGALYDP